MTRISEGSLSCPGCGHEQPFTHHDSVNVTLSPELKEKLLSRELTTFRCSKCGVTAQVVGQILYHDMTQQLMIWLLPEDESVPEDPSLLSGPLGVFTDMLTRRWVQSFNELVEKISIFDDGLDDRVMELSKLLICLQEPSFQEGQLLYDGLHEADEETTAQFVHLLNEESQGLSVPWASLSSASEKLLGSLPSQGEEKQTGWVRIDQEWAASVFADAALDE